MYVSGPKEEKVLEVCEELQNSGFTILKLFHLLKENGHFDAMKTLKRHVPDELYKSVTSHLPDVITVDDLKIPNIHYEELKDCCNGYVILTLQNLKRSDRIFQLN